MPAGYTKEDVVFHGTGYGIKLAPAVNVKVYHYPEWWRVDDLYSTGEKLACDALGIVLWATQNLFWNKEVPTLVDKHLRPRFGAQADAHSAGRSAGWVVGIGIGDKYDVQDWWNALDLTAWYAFQKAVKGTVNYLTSWEYVHQEIQELDAIGAAKRGIKLW